MIKLSINTIVTGAIEYIHLKSININTTQYVNFRNLHVRLSGLTRMGSPSGGNNNIQIIIQIKSSVGGGGGGGDSFFLLTYRQASEAWVVAEEFG